MKNDNNGLKVSIEKEVSKSYLEYSMSVIVSRALPDVRDGLKPVHRRILYSMYKLKNFWNKKYKKSARIVGDVIGKFHPHGDISVYEAIVRMCQKFSLRYALIEGQGNFGSLDGDSAAAMRYTEIRISRIGSELLTDINKKTVKFVVNYDGTEKQPTVLPSKIPNLLINGSYGIAVGMMTNIPPHNLNETIKACIYFLNNDKCSIKKLVRIIKGPDFPTSGIILDCKKLNKVYKKGKGKIVLRAKLHLEELNYGKNLAIVVKELPYSTSKSIFLEKLLNLIKNKIFFEVSNIKDESNKFGLRILIIIKNNINLENFIDKLYKMTSLENNFNVNMVALVNKKPKLLNLKEIIKYFIKHRKNIITKRYLYELEIYKKNCYILEGLIVALENINKIINLIKFSKNNKLAKIKIKNEHWKSENLSSLILKIKKNNSFFVFKEKILFKKKNIFNVKDFYKFSDLQIKKILSIKINKINKMENSFYLKKYENIVLKIIEITKILYSKKKIKNIIKSELKIISKNYIDKRKTKLKF